MVHDQGRETVDVSLLWVGAYVPSFAALKARCYVQRERTDLRCGCDLEVVCHKNKKLKEGASRPI